MNSIPPSKWQYNKRLYNSLTFLVEANASMSNVFSVKCLLKAAYSDSYRGLTMEFSAVLHPNLMAYFSKRTGIIKTPKMHIEFLASYQFQTFEGQDLTEAQPASFNWRDGQLIHIPLLNMMFLSS